MLSNHTDIWSQKYFFRVLFFANRRSYARYVDSAPYLPHPRFQNHKTDTEKTTKKKQSKNYLGQITTAW